MFLTFAAVLLLVVVTVQNILYPPLREETVSDGLYGPYHWWLDGAYLILISALLATFPKLGLLPEIFSAVAAGSLFITMISNTFSKMVDSFTGNRHALIHTWFSILMFLAMLGLQIVTNHTIGLWIISVCGLLVPLVLLAVLSLWRLPGVVIGPQVEKAAILLLCFWLFIWGIQ